MVVDFYESVLVIVLCIILFIPFHLSHIYNLVLCFSLYILEATLAYKEYITKFFKATTAHIAFHSMPSYVC
jgi:hypothetical protein